TPRPSGSATPRPADASLTLLNPRGTIAPLFNTPGCRVFSPARVGPSHGGRHGSGTLPFRPFPDHPPRVPGTSPRGRQGLSRGGPAVSGDGLGRLAAVQP